MIEVTPLTPFFGARITGLDNRRPLTREEVVLVDQAMAEHAVVCVAGLSTREEDQVSFTRNFGGLEVPQPGGYMSNYISRVGPELFDAGNIDEKGDILGPDAPLRQFSKGNELWHTDSSYNTLPVKWSLLMAYIIPPEGGDTQFCDTRDAFDRLTPAEQSEVEGVEIVHDLWHSREKRGYKTTAEERAKRKPVVKPLVRVSQNGRKALYLGEHAASVVGWPNERGRQLIEHLMTVATAPDRVYTHKWAVGDLVIWDNRCTLHRADGFDSFRHKRDMRRTTTLEIWQDMDATMAKEVD